MNQTQTTPPPSQLRSAVRGFATAISLLVALVGVALALVARDLDAAAEHAERAADEARQLEQLADEEAPSPTSADADSDPTTDTDVVHSDVPETP